MARRTTATKAAPRNVGGMITSLDSYAAALGLELRTIAGERAACRVDERGQVVMAVVDLPTGSNSRGSYAGAGGLRLGSAHLASVDGSGWSVGDGNGWLDPEFPSLEAAVQALTTKATLAAMQQRTDKWRQLYALEREMRDAEPIPGALPCMNARARGWL